MVFMDAPKTMKELKMIGATLPVPALFNAVMTGKEPNHIYQPGKRSGI